VCGSEILKTKNRSIKEYEKKKFCSNKCSGESRRLPISPCKIEQKARRNIRKGYLHRGYEHPIYTAWKNMRRRCYSLNFKQYSDYGGRGISVCSEWRSDFVSFLRWALDNGWEKGLTLDRINNDGNYEPKNCRWATWREQLTNTRRNHMIEYNGKTKTITEWSEELNIHVNTLTKRLTAWKDVALCFETPVNHKYGRIRKRKE